MKTVALKLILETESIVHPLAGIGRYTYELASAFANHSEIADLKLFNRGAWQSPDDLDSVEKKDTGNTARQEEAVHPTQRLKHRLTRNRLTIAAYRRLIPSLHNRRLKVYSGTHVYHSPNFMLLPYSGPKVVTFHDLSVLKYPQFHPKDRIGKLRPEMEKAARNADHIITDSKVTRTEVIDYFKLPEDRVSAIHLASSLPPSSSEQSAREAWLKTQQLQQGRYFLFVSTLEPRKNLAMLLTAFEQLPLSLRQRYPLVLVGQLGWGSDALAEQLANSSARQQILRPGYLTNAQLSHLYAGATAMVYPSLYEGFGLPIVEAQGFGTPVITSNLSCMPEVAGNGALLVEPSDPQDIARGMQRVAEDEVLAGELSTASTANAQRFSWKNTADATIAVYRKVAGIT